MALYITLPERYTLGPAWLLPALEAALLVPLTIAVPHRAHDEPRWHRWLSVGLIALVTGANVVSLAVLVEQLLVGSSTAEGRQLVVAATQIWLTNILVFALWYRELDRGGPAARARVQQAWPDFQFPQMTVPQLAPGWAPRFVDYLYLAFTNATAFSPTDVMPLTRWAKLLMLVQALASLVTVALVAARAVNILGQP